MLIWLGGCARASLERFAETEARAGQVPAALAVADQERAIGRDLPAYPSDCRRQYRSGVRVGDRLDAAVLKSDRALAGANAQIVACASWYDDLRAGVAGETGG